jgi:hypothetical protein
LFPFALDHFQYFIKWRDELVYSFTLQFLANLMQINA